MEKHSVEKDVVVISYKSLVVPIKTSHHLLLRQLYAGLLIIPIVVIFFLIMLSYVPAFLSDLMTLLFLGLGAAAAIWMIKKSYSFMRAGGRSVIEIEQATTTSQLTTGLMSYMNQVSDFLQPPTLRGRKSTMTLPDSLKRLESYMNKGLKPLLLEITVLGMVLAGVVPFFSIVTSETGNPFQLYVVLGSLVTLFVFRWLLSIKWRPLVRQWLLVSQELAN